MTRRCDLTGKSAQYGFQVSHANNRTHRRFEVNLQQSSLLSEALGRTVRLRVSTNALKTVEKYGGLDGYLMSADDSVLSVKAQRLKRTIGRLRSRAAA